MPPSYLNIFYSLQKWSELQTKANWSLKSSKSTLNVAKCNWVVNIFLTKFHFRVSLNVFILTKSRFWQNSKSWFNQQTRNFLPVYGFRCLRLWLWFELIKFQTNKGVYVLDLIIRKNRLYKSFENTFIF